MHVKVKKLHPNAVIPTYAKQGDSGFDLVAIEDTLISPEDTTLIRTGLAFEIPEGYELQVRPRSGITHKTALRVQLGTVDSGYRGEVRVITDNLFANIGVADSFPQDLTDECITTYTGEAVIYGTYLVRKGDKIAQGVICPVQRVELIESDSLSESERDTGGFGSTGV